MPNEQFLATQETRRSGLKALRAALLPLPKYSFGRGLSADVEQAVRAALAEYESWAPRWSR